MRAQTFSAEGWVSPRPRLERKKGGVTVEPMGRPDPAQLSITLCHRDRAIPQPSHCSWESFSGLKTFQSRASTERAHTHTERERRSLLRSFFAHSATKKESTRGLLLWRAAYFHHERRTDVREEDSEYFDRPARIYELPPELQGLPDAARVFGDGHGLLQRTDVPRPPRILPESGVRTAHELLPPPVQSERNGSSRSVRHEIRIPIHK